MKKTIFLVLIFSVSLLTKVNSQNLKNDCEFYKSTTYLLSSLHTIDGVVKSKYNETDLKNALLLLEKNKSKIEKSFNILKLKYSKDKDFTTYENWILFNRNISKMLQESQESQEKNSSFTLGLYLINLDINDFLDKKY
jgi:hypothetical protein